MRTANHLVATLGICALTALPTLAQNPREAFSKSGLKVGSQVPDLTVHDESGDAFPLKQRFTGQYTVLVTGCLT